MSLQGLKKLKLEPEHTVTDKLTNVISQVRWGKRRPDLDEFMESCIFANLLPNLLPIDYKFTKTL